MLGSMQDLGNTLVPLRWTFPENQLLNCSSESYFPMIFRTCSVKLVWFYYELIIWVLSFSEDTLGQWACWSRDSFSKEEMNTSSFRVWGRREYFQVSKEINLSVNLWATSMYFYVSWFPSISQHRKSRKLLGPKVSQWKLHGHYLYLVGTKISVYGQKLRHQHLMNSYSL